MCDTFFCKSRQRHHEFANVMGLSEEVQKDLAMCKMQRELQKRVSSMFMLPSALISNFKFKLIWHINNIRKTLVSSLFGGWDMPM